MFNFKNNIVQNDLREITSLPISWKLLEGKSCLVTGANGMIATYIIYSFMYMIRKYDINIHIVALSRNRLKMEELFFDFLNDSHFELLVQDVCEPIHYEGRLDYIFHFAGNASPFYIKNDPVGIMKSNLFGTINVLELAKEKKVNKVIFASTREVYGENIAEACLTEKSFGRIDCLEARSCYPESKRAAEALFRSYYLQYGVNFNTVRIAHAYGPGMKLENDGRVMADLLKFVLHRQNIVLNSTGEALRSFCYVNDVISGLAYILFYGEKAQAYNLANEKEEISIKNLAEMLIKKTHESLCIEYKVNHQSKVYCNYKRIGLDTLKLESLGWSPSILLEEGLERILRSFYEKNK